MLLNPDGHIVANTYEMMTGAFVRNRDFRLPGKDMRERLEAAVPEGHALLTDATDLARHLLGDTIGANLFLLGVAWQKGLIPLGRAAIAEAIHLNGVAIDLNLSAFAWGRAWAVDPDRIETRSTRPNAAPDTIDVLIEDRSARLTAYQNAAYAAEYATFIQKVAAQDPDPDRRLTRATARNLYKLMAYKDEFEVARLLTNDSFEAAIHSQFEGDYRITHHLAPPMLPGTDPATGRPKKRAFGPWIRPALRGLAKLKWLRGTWADPFGYTAERRMERALIDDYRDGIKAILSDLTTESYEDALQLADLPNEIRGFGPVKHASATAYQEKWIALEAKYLEMKLEKRVA